MTGAYAYTALHQERENVLIQQTDYVFKTKPWEHQAEAFGLSRDEEFFALFMEQRTGKTKVIVDTAAWLYAKGEIDCLFILAPNGVHRLWVSDEIPTHMPEHIQTAMFLWTNGRLNTQKGQKLFGERLRSTKLAIFAFNIEAMSTEKGKEAARAILNTRRCLFVIDESTTIKTPGSKRTRTLIGRGKARGLGEHAAYRRILTGTPSPQGPFDLYSQMKFLDKDFWADMGSFHGFKHHFGVFDRGFNSRTGQAYDELVEYKNIEELNARIAAHSFRVLRDDCFDTPDQIFQKKVFELAPDQRKVYNELRDELIIEIDDGEIITAELAIVRLMRLQQVASNFIPREDGTLIQISEKNPRLEAMAELIEEDRQHQNIIWCRFNEEADQLCDLADRMGIKHARYDGQVTEKQRAKNKKQFQDGTARLFIGKAQVGGRGLELAMARNTFYYSNSFDLEHRLQSQDRTQSKQQKHSVGVTDLIALETGDEKIVETLRSKRSVAAMITGDTLKDWI